MCIDTKPIQVGAKLGVPKVSWVPAGYAGWFISSTMSPYMAYCRGTIFGQTIWLVYIIYTALNAFPGENHTRDQDATELVTAFPMLRLSGVSPFRISVIGHDKRQCQMLKTAMGAMNFWKVWNFCWFLLRCVRKWTKTIWSTPMTHDTHEDSSTIRNTSACWQPFGIFNITGWWLNPTPLKNMSSSIGILTFPIYGKIKNVPNHQPDDYGKSMEITIFRGKSFFRSYVSLPESIFYSSSLAIVALWQIKSIPCLCHSITTPGRQKGWSSLKLLKVHGSNPFKTMGFKWIWVFSLIFLLTHIYKSHQISCFFGVYKHPSSKCQIDPSMLHRLQHRFQFRTAELQDANCEREGFNISYN